MQDGGSVTYPKTVSKPVALELSLYDSLTRTKRKFEPVRPGHASVYLCGATVQTIPHIGHIRSGVAFDILRNWLTACGLDVAFVRNVTNIDDKILTKAAENGRPWWEWAQTHEREFAKAYQILGVTPPSLEPRATGHIPEMISYMERIIAAGHGYAADGNVYFATASLPDYGQLSGQKLEEMEDQGEHEGTGKRDPRDFTLWKAAKPGEPAWDTPWGPGRPGWHLECSAMATRYLGGTFDIHGGGLDLKFPHHENEIAQAHAAGDEFARFWLHNGWVTMAGEKMSKSLGNVLSIAELTKIVRPVELRYYLGSAHYRSMLEYSLASLQEAAAGYRRIEAFVLRANDLAPVEPGELPADFIAAMNDDLGVPAALAVVHNTVRAGNQALAQGDQAAVAKAAGQVRAMTAILGVDPLVWQAGSAQGNAKEHAALDSLIQAALAKRAAARAAKNWAVADQVRDELLDAGIEVIDTPEGAKWQVKG